MKEYKYSCNCIRWSASWSVLTRQILFILSLSHYFATSHSHKLEIMTHLTSHGWQKTTIWLFFMAAHRVNLWFKSFFFSFLKKRKKKKNQKTDLLFLSAGRQRTSRAPWSSSKFTLCWINNSKTVLCDSAWFEFAHNNNNVLFLSQGQKGEPGEPGTDGAPGENGIDVSTWLMFGVQCVFEKRGECVCVGLCVQCKKHREGALKNSNETITKTVWNIQRGLMWKQLNKE